jgi:hypothetical protein
MSQYDERIEAIVPFIAAGSDFGMQVSTALTRMGKACWEFTDGTLPVYIGQWTLLSMSREYAALLSLQASEVYFELRRSIERFRKMAADMTDEQRALALADVDFLQDWLASIEIMAQEAAEIDGDE